MFAIPLKTNSSLYNTSRPGVWIALPGVFADQPGEPVPMCPKDLIDALEKVLVERLCESSGAAVDGPLDVVRTAMHKMRRAIQPGQRVSPGSPAYPAVVSRVRSLPESVRELLRRHYVFLEAEESICGSMNMTSKQFRKLRREAVDYVLMRRAHPACVSASPDEGKE